VEKSHMTVINDSKATAIESVLSATESTVERYRNHPIYIFIGGRDKMLPWQDLDKLFLNQNLKIILFGEHAKIIANLFQHRYSTQILGVYPKLNSAIESLPDLIDKNMKHNVFLLSPGGSSLDEFKNFEER